MEKKFGWQICQDEGLNEKFCELHHTLVEQIIVFCKDNNLEIDDVHLDIDGFRDSIQFGQWTAASDSAMTMFRFDEEHTHRQNRSEVEPFLCSM